MSYLLMIVEPRGQREARSLAEGQDAYAQMLRWGEGLKSRGVLAASESLRSDHDGARLQVRDGKTIVRDGPFAEAKEMIGGFFLLNCERRDEALAIAESCPAAAWATVEVREIAPCYVP
jgi:hypothetical protein